MHHHGAHDEEEAEGGALLVLQEPRDMQKFTQLMYGACGRCPEEVEADAEKDGIKYAGDEDPFPDLMFGDKMMRFDIRLKGYDDLFEQFSFCLLLL